MSIIYYVTPSLIEDFFRKLPAFRLNEDIECLDFTYIKEKDTIQAVIRDNHGKNYTVCLNQDNVIVNNRAYPEFLMYWHSYLYYAFGEIFLKEFKEDFLKKGNSNGAITTMIATKMADTIKMFSIKLYGQVIEIKSR